MDEAHAEAEHVAREAAEAVKGTASIETEVGDPNPLQAIENALRSFPADELIIVTRPGTASESAPRAAPPKPAAAPNTGELHSGGAKQ